MRGDFEEKDKVLGAKRVNGSDVEQVICQDMKLSGMMAGIVVERDREPSTEIINW